MKTDLSLVLFQLPSCWQGSLTVHFSLSKQIGIYPSYCLSSAFAFIYVYLTKYSIECKSNVIAQYFFIFFHLFPYLSFLASKNFCSQENFTQRLTTDVKYYGKRKRMTTLAQILRDPKRMNEHLARNKTLRRKIRKCEHGFRNLILINQHLIADFYFQLRTLTDVLQEKSDNIFSNFGVRVAQ